jgi:UDP-3-O-[3-hydroxymyristoyl] N-acetylglucosamine deacetylase
MLRQRTIKQVVHAIGIGVHSAKKVRMTLRPAGENTGITFVRTDEHYAQVRARAANVWDTTLSTTIAEGGVRVATVEHLLSALWGMGVDNLLVELTSEEVPIMDGSSAPFVNLINMVGTVEQSAPREYIRIIRPVRVDQGDAWTALEPFDGFAAGYTFESEHPVYDQYPKRAELDFSEICYQADLSRARSFGLVAELAQAQAISRCLGSSLENAVGIGDSRILNPEGLRYNEEFVKHKILDAIGDLFLLGRPLIGRFSGHKSGHALNNKLARALLRCEDAWEIVRPQADQAGRVA